MDINSAYLYGHLKEGKVIYLAPPPGNAFKDLQPSQKLCLKVTLYGLKQAGCCLALVLHDILFEISLTHLQHNHAGFFCHLPDNHVAIISSHINDITLIVPDTKTLKLISSKICMQIQVTPLQELHWLLGIEI